MSISTVFLFVNTALIAGIAFGCLAMQVQMFVVSAVGVVFSACISSFWSKKIWIGIACTIAACCGIWLVVAFSKHAETSYRTFADTLPNTFQADVVYVDAESLPMYITVSVLKNMRVTISSYERSIRVGDTISFSCETLSPFSFSTYARSRVLGHCGIQEVVVVSESIHTSPVAQVKEKIVTRLETLLPSPESDMIAGIVLGEKRSLPDDIALQLKQTGTVHIVVLSGYNISVVVAWVVMLARFFRKGVVAQMVLGIVVILLIIALAGFSAPAVRASIMASVGLVSVALGRGVYAFRALLFSATLLLLRNPLALGFDASFQLSFLATLGVMYTDKISPSFRFLPSRFAIRENMKTTFAATMMTLPVVAMISGGISLIALLANAVILPFVPAIFLLGVITMVIGSLWIPAGIVIGAIAYALTRLLLLCVELFSLVPYAYITASIFSIPATLVWFLSIVVYARVKKKNQDVRFAQKRGSRVGMLLVGVCGFLVIGLFCFGYFGPKQFVTFFDVGQGDAAHIRDATGGDVIIDGGPSASLLASRVGRDMPYVDRTIDVVVITHPHADHLQGIYGLIGRYHIRELWISGTAITEQAYRDIVLELQATGTRVRVVQAGDEGTVGETSLSVLWPRADFSTRNLNHASVVLKATLSDKTFLFMGDAEKEVESELIHQSESELRTHVLKVGHHGSASASSVNFLTAVSPTVSVISAGKENRYGHPNIQTLERFREMRIPVLRTDLCGAIRFVFPYNRLSIISRCPS